MIALLLLLCIQTAQGQSTNVRGAFKSNFEKAEMLYSQLAYRNALELYLATVEKDSSNLVARQRAADCYFRLNNINEAEQWYGALAGAPNVPPEYLYQYAQVLTMQGKYEEAQEWLVKYQKVSEDPRAKSKLEFIRHINYYYRDSLLYAIRNEPFNSDQSDFAPQYYNGGSVFVSARDRDLFIKHHSASALNEKESMLNIYFAPKGAVSEPDAINFDKQNLNSPYHDGPIAFFDGNKKAVFSRNNLHHGKPVQNSGRVNLKLYFGEVDAVNGMRNIEPFEFNDDKYSIGHPWMSDDGQTLYFASNMPGGQGGVDLYITEKKNGKWSTPENLGSAINTPGDEFYPFLANDSTLYFSSTGHGGLGGLDIYVSARRESKYSSPENLGYPLNTPSDDFSMILAAGGRNGMFASNRPGGVGYDDLYSFEVKSFFVSGKTVDRKNIVKRIGQVKVIVSDDAGVVVDSAYSDKNGYFHFDLDFDKSYVLTSANNDYGWNAELAYSTKTRAMGRDSIVLPVWKNDLFAKGVIYNNETQEKLAGAIVTIRNVTDGVIDSVVTSAAGAYNFLLRSNKKYIIGAKKDGFIANDFELNTAGITTGDLLNDMVLEEVFLEKVVVQFDIKKWNIKPQYLAPLDKVARVMKRNKKYHVHIAAHADSNGTHEFNLDLSIKRANAVAMALESRGVETSRITAVGFGEELLLNQCSNGVNCSLEEHAINRRAELKVQQTK
jgi:outer membrane protein OmpA-like peptidoglycan-associated protein